MDIQHVNVKIYVEGDLTVDPARFIDIFHGWIAKQAQEKLVDELLIDVADYRHVPSGPGVMLIGFEADYSMDNIGNRYGLRYNRKAALDGTNEDRLGQALRSAARACRELESEFEEDGALKFSRREFELFINDRALAPNTPDTFAALKPELEAFLRKALGHGDFTLEHQSDPRRLFRVTVKTATPFDLAAIAGAGA